MAAAVDSVPITRLRELKQKVCNCIDNAKDKLYCLSADIWSCPELAYEEKRSHDKLVTFFSEEIGWDVESHYKLDTAFRATWGPVGGKEDDVEINIGFLCEYDALPGIGHACGHNLIAEVGVAAAIGLKGVVESIPDCPVRVKVILPEEVCKPLKKRLSLLPFGCSPYKPRREGAPMHSLS